MDDYNKAIIDEFRANHGKVSGTFNGMELLLLTTTGAKSGRSFTKPLAYTMDGDTFVIIASKGGAPTNPAWYHNLKTHPEAEIEVGADKIKVRAKEATGDEHDRLYAQHATKYPQFNDYKAKTSRVIPVFVLEQV